MERGCCEHCDTVGHLDEKLDALIVATAKLETDFTIVRRLVYGTAGAFLVAIVTTLGTVAVRAMGF